MQLASRFASQSPVLRADHPLSDDQIRAVAPSIFGEDKHASRSERYSYIPTNAVLTELRKEGFQPFMICQTRVRQDDRRNFTKHMIRLRHASQINGAEANEVILLNSHDGTSSYQMLAGMFRFVCKNGLVCGDTVADVRVPHKGDVAAQVMPCARPRWITGKPSCSPARRWLSSTTTRPSLRRSRKANCWRPGASMTTTRTCGGCSTSAKKASSKAACPAVPPMAADSAPGLCRVSTRTCASTARCGCSPMACSA